MPLASTVKPWVKPLRTTRSLAIAALPTTNSSSMKRHSLTLKSASSCNQTGPRGTSARRWCCKPRTNSTSPSSSTKLAWRRTQPMLSASSSLKRPKRNKLCERCEVWVACQAWAACRAWAVCLVWAVWEDKTVLSHRLNSRR